MTAKQKLVSGIVAGLVGSCAMQLFRVGWEARSGATAASGIFGFDEEADLNSIAQLCRLTGLREPEKVKAMQAALLLHYGYGAFSGAVYQLLAEWLPGTRTAYGLAFGTALWAVGDELAITLSGLSDPFARKPSSHGSALFAHLLFGLTTEMGHRIARKLIH